MRGELFERTGSRGALVPPFVAGAIAVVTVHQPVLWLLHARGLAPWPAWSTVPTRPFAVPAVVSATLWGGAWAVLLARTVRGAGSRRTRLAGAALFGAVAPNLVGAALAALGHVPAPRSGGAASAALSAVIVNGCWAIATIALLDVVGRHGKAPEPGT